MIRKGDLMVKRALNVSHCGEGTACVKQEGGRHKPSTC